LLDDDGAAVLGMGLILLEEPCSTLEGVPVTGEIIYRDAGSGAKGGLSVSPGEAPRVWLRLPSFEHVAEEIQATK